MKHSKARKEQRARSAGIKKSTEKSSASRSSATKSPASRKASAKKPASITAMQSISDSATSYLKAHPLLATSASLLFGGAVGLGVVTAIRKLFTVRDAAVDSDEGTFDNMSTSDSFDGDKKNLDREFGAPDRPSTGEGFDTQYTGAYPRNSGAVSSLNNGSPEDLNYMPATENPSIEGPIYDGTQLGSAP